MYLQFLKVTLLDKNYVHVFLDGWKRDAKTFDRKICFAIRQTVAN